MNLFFWQKKKRSFNPGLLKLDMHNHILPGVDDGVEDRQEAIRLLQNMRAAGYETVIITPHIFKELFPNTGEGLRKRWDAFLPFIEAEIPELHVGLAAEYHFDEFFRELLARGEDLLCIRDEAVLIEFPLMSNPPAWKESFFELSTKGFRPVLAHVERYGYLGRSDWEELKNRGVLIQVNLLALNGTYGPGMKRRAEKLLEGGFIDLWGTDLHSGAQWDLFEQLELPGDTVDILEETEWLNQIWNSSND